MFNAWLEVWRALVWGYAWRGIRSRVLCWTAGGVQLTVSNFFLPSYRHSDLTHFQAHYSPICGSFLPVTTSPSRLVPPFLHLTTSTLPSSTTLTSHSGISGSPWRLGQRGIGIKVARKGSKLRDLIILQLSSSMFAGLRDMKIITNAYVCPQSEDYASAQYSPAWRNLRHATRWTERSNQAIRSPIPAAASPPSIKTSNTDPHSDSFSFTISLRVYGLEAAGEIKASGSQCQRWSAA